MHGALKYYYAMYHKFTHTNILRPISGRQQYLEEYAGKRYMDV